MSLRTSLKRLAERATGTARLHDQRDAIAGKLTAMAEGPYDRLMDQAVDDGALADAVSNIVRLDAEIEASIRRGETSGPEGAELTPAHAALEAQRDALIVRLRDQPAEGLLGLRAKAHALQLATIQEEDESTSDIASGLSADVLRLTAGRNRLRLGSHARPDPILSAVAAAQVAEAIADAFDASPPLLPRRTDQWRLQSDALSEKFFASREAVWQTRPSTAEGWQALIAYARSQVLKGIDENDDLLGYGPLLTIVFGALSAAASTADREA